MRALYLWKNDRPEKHPEWSSLFFDLIYVGITFNAGSIIAFEISWKSMLTFLVLFICLFDSWTKKVCFNGM